MDKGSELDGPEIGRLVEREMARYNARRRQLRATGSAEQAGAYRYASISREAGSLGEEVAGALAERLLWHVFDKELVEYIARDAHVRERIVKELDEKAQTLIQDTIERLLRLVEGGSFGEEEYHRGLLQALATISAQGGAVFVGHGATFALREPAGIHIRIMASAQTRIERLSRKWQVPPDQAERRMREADTDFREFIRHHFKSDPDDLTYYDLVFNTDHLTVGQVVTAVMSVIQRADTQDVRTAGK
jgi:cytidylate kinase